MNEIYEEPMVAGFIKSDRRDESAYRNMLREARNGELVKVRNGVYATVDGLAAGMIDVESVVPGGILCLYSAWHYYGMTTQIPDAYYISIDRKRKVRLPEILDINLVYQTPSLLNIGKTSVTIEGIDVMIYDRERCLCDALKYRNKIGIDVMNEILNAYLQDRERNLSRLSDYAPKLRVYNLLSTYLNVKL